MIPRGIDPEALTKLRDAALSRTPVSLGPRRTATPHEFYRYPARFSPEVATSTIRAFSEPGDLVADYFVGGGTTLVEARLAGRVGVGSDINALSVFVSRVKTRLYAQRDLDEVVAWADRIQGINAPVAWLPDAQSLTYFRNFDGDHLSDQRRVIFAALQALKLVSSRRAKDLARCVLLRTAQWGLDMRRQVPTGDELHATILDNAAAMIAVARRATTLYRAADHMAGSNGLPRSLVLHQGLPGVAVHAALARHPSPRLVLTSPPYPGVYVNYHRWKLRGRLEMPLPYYIAGERDGHGLAHYTMAARSDRTQGKYFRMLESAFSDVAKLCGPDTWLAQVVGFNDVEDQLPRYLSTMNRAGFREVTFGQLATAEDGRLWRNVPGRRWWARAGARSAVVQHTAREVVLFHRLLTQW